MGDRVTLHVAKVQGDNCNTLCSYIQTLQYSIVSVLKNLQIEKLNKNIADLFEP